MQSALCSVRMLTRVAISGKAIEELVGPCFPLLQLTTGFFFSLRIRINFHTHTLKFSLIFGVFLAIQCCLLITLLTNSGVNYSWSLNDE